MNRQRSGKKTRRTAQLFVLPPVEDAVNEHVSVAGQSPEQRVPTSQQKICLTHIVTLCRRVHLCHDVRIKTQFESSRITAAGAGDIVFIKKHHVVISGGQQLPPIFLTGLSLFLSEQRALPFRELNKLHRLIES